MTATEEARKAIEWLDRIDSTGLGLSGAETAARDALISLLSRLEAAEKVIAETLSIFRPGASVPLGVSEARHVDRLLAEGHRILSAYTKGTDR